MALNPFFTQGTRNEQDLLQSLNNEMIKMYGVECYYLPRKFLTTNTVIKEVIQSKFDDCLLYTSPSPRDRQKSRMPSSA